MVDSSTTTSISTEKSKHFLCEDKYETLHQFDVIPKQYSPIENMTHDMTYISMETLSSSSSPSSSTQSPYSPGYSPSPTSPGNGVTSTSNLEDDIKLQKLSVREPLLPPCRVCGEKASGLHYGVNTCEACKGFFRRSLQRKEQYQCPGTNNCTIEPGKRNVCARCRYVKCLSVGMSKDAIKTGRYTHEKRTRDTTEVKNLQRKSISSSDNAIERIHSQITDSKEHEIVKYIEHLTRTAAQIDPQGAGLHAGNGNSLKQFAEQIKLKEEMFGQMEPISTDEFKQFKEATGIDLDNRRDIINNWTTMIETGIKRLVSFAKTIPSFTDLTLKDQSTLIKAGRFEVGFIGLQRRFSIPFNCFTGLHGKTIHKVDMCKVWDADYVESMFTMAAHIQSLKLSYPENILMMGIILTFSDRECELDNAKAVEEIQEKMVTALEYSLKVSHPEDKLIFPRVLVSLMKLRELSVWNKKVVDMVQLDWPDIQFPPLICELFA